MRTPFAICITLALAGCAVSYGERATGFLNPQLADAYIPLEGVSLLVLKERAAAFVVAPGVAVTNAHNMKIIDAPIIGQSRNYDLIFFHVEKNSTLQTAAPVVGEEVIAYGQDARSGQLNEAHGTIEALNVEVEARCETCAAQSAFTYVGDAGPGFSGGPVVDAKSGRLVGITFGFLDPNGRRTMYAYPMSRVRNELATIEHQLPVDVD